jgi:hypothetical protein
VLSGLTEDIAYEFPCVIFPRSFVFLKGFEVNIVIIFKKYVVVCFEICVKSVNEVTKADE